AVINSCHFVFRGCFLGFPKIFINDKWADVNIMEAAAGEMDDRNGWSLRDSSGWRGDFGVRCG
ncbi:unnamed protein product, partial [Pylaiella littoralis]